MSKAKTKTNEIDNIRDDVQSLKSNILALSKQVGNEGKTTAASLGTKAYENVDHFKEKTLENISNLQDFSKDRLAAAETEVKTHPGRSMAIAFGAGVLLSALIRRRS
jgi:ElaB/YqjD/DUF883 family membrane-anchored ribosome-binding protein